MLEGEETKWRLGVEPEQAEERAAELSSEEDEQKEELQQTIQARADEIGGGGEGSIATGAEEEPITEVLKKKERKAKALTVKKSEPNTSKDMTKQIERQANQLARIEKATRRNLSAARCAAHVCHIASSRRSAGSETAVSYGPHR